MRVGATVPEVVYDGWGSREIPAEPVGTLPSAAPILNVRRVLRRSSADCPERSEHLVAPERKAWSKRGAASS